MDKNNGQGLNPENQKWLDDLFSHSEDVSANELAKQFKAPDVQEVIEQPVVPEEPEKVDNDELEKILAEDWSSVPEPEDLNDIESYVAKTVLDESTPLSDDEAAETEAASEQPEEEIAEKKGRPKKKDEYGLLGIPHILSTVIWLVLILAIGISLGRLLWVCCADVMAFGKEPQKVAITITEDDTISTISKKLGQANLVRYPKLFKFFAQVTGKDEDIGTGTFTLNSQLDYNAMINAMVSYGPKREVVDIMFPEGINCAQIFKLLEEKNVCSVADLEAYAIDGELSDYWFLEGVSRGDKYCLEGYMAPDTYTFYTNDEPRRVIEKFLDEFDSRFTDKMKTDFETMKKSYASMLKASGFSSAYIEEHTLTLHQLVTLASVIQRETSSNDESYDIASVFYNRLSNPNILSLGADATVYYALGDYFGEIEELTAEHLGFDSPYNTRKNQGIPPGPICNMGVHSLYAALEPNDTNFHYFVYDKEKSAHRFAVTEREHLQNVAELMGD